MTRTELLLRASQSRNAACLLAKTSTQYVPAGRGFLRSTPPSTHRATRFRLVGPSNLANGASAQWRAIVAGSPANSAGKLRSIHVNQWSPNDRRERIDRAEANAEAPSQSTSGAHFGARHFGATSTLRAGCSSQRTHACKLAALARRHRVEGEWQVACRSNRHAHAFSR